MASNLGYEVILIGDACVSFDRILGEEVFDAELVHKVSLASLNNEFVTVMSLADYESLI